MPRQDKAMNRADYRKWYERPENRAKVVEAQRQRRADPEYREAERARRRAAYAANPERFRDEQKQRRPQLLASQRRRAGVPQPPYTAPTVCECCGSPPGVKPLACDHDHATGLFRGWLCNRCNLGLGQLGDTVAGLMRAVRYLQTAALLGRVG